MKYICYVDILGFEKIPHEIANKTGFDEEYIRSEFLTKPFREKINSINKNIITLDKSISEIEGSDSYLIIFEQYDGLINSLNELLTINIPHNDYENIPLEIALDIIDIEKNNIDLINKGEVITFLKSDTIEKYKRRYKKINNKSIIDSFVVCSNSFFNSLFIMDKDKFTKWMYDGNTFYEASIEYINNKTRMYQFLNKIGLNNNSFYGYIDELYVPPVEYQDIMKSLQENKIVFLTGTAEYGKTYTAIKILWEYYKNGYEITWNKGNEPEERKIVRTYLEFLEEVIQEHCINYLEDPFGKVKYERRESLEREIANSLTTVRLNNESYVVITSREEVFKEFENEVLSKNQLERYEKSLNIKKPSYDYERRMEILKLWSNYYQCDWINNIEQFDEIEFLMTDDKNLTTPLSIKSFASASRKTSNLEDLIQIFLNKSEETFIVFAKEIMEMSLDKQIFLIFPFIGTFNKKRMKRLYNYVIKNINIKSAEDFEFIYDWFINDKISILFYNIDFSHPSYYESFIHIIKNHKNSITYNFLNDALAIIGKKREYIKDIMDFLNMYYTYIKKDVRESILNNAINNNMNDYISNLMLNNYEYIPKDVIDKGLKLISKYQSSALDSIQIIELYKDDIDKELKQNLIINLSKMDGGELTNEILYEIFNNDYELYFIKKILMNLSNKYNNNMTIINYLKDQIDSLNKNIRIDLISKLIKFENQEIIESISRVIRDKFLFFDNEEIIKYCDLLINQEYASHIFGWILINNFDAFNIKNVKNYVKIMSEKLPYKRIASRILYLKYYHFDLDFMESILIPLSKEEECVVYIIKIIKNENNEITKTSKNTIISNLKNLKGPIEVIVKSQFN